MADSATTATRSPRMLLSLGGREAWAY